MCMIGTVDWVVVATFLRWLIRRICAKKECLFQVWSTVAEGSVLLLLLLAQSPALCSLIIIWSFPRNLFWYPLLHCLDAECQRVEACIDCFVEDDNDDHCCHLAIDHLYPSEPVYPSAESLPLVWLSLSFFFYSSSSLFLYISICHLTQIIISDLAQRDESESAGEREKCVCTPVVINAPFIICLPVRWSFSCFIQYIKALITR